MTELRWPPKNPQDILDDAGILRGEKVKRSAFGVPRGLVKLSGKADETRTQPCPRGGEDGRNCVMANRICTGTGRVVKEHITLSVIDDVYSPQESS